MQSRKVIPQKLWVCICNNGFPYPSHQVKQIVHIVYTQQMCTCSFLGSNVMDVSASESQSALRGRTADCAFAVWLYGGKVGGVGGVAEV
jgi:hypothetical protein